MNDFFISCHYQAWYWNYFESNIKTKKLKKMTNKKNLEWVEINGTSIYTGWPLLQQLAALGCKIELTANAPYPTFMVTYNPSHYWLFNQSGGEVITMVGTFKAFSFNEVADCRDLLPTED